MPRSGPVARSQVSREPRKIPKESQTLLENAEKEQGGARTETARDYAGTRATAVLLHETQKGRAREYYPAQSSTHIAGDTAKNLT